MQIIVHRSQQSEWENRTARFIVDYAQRHSYGVTFVDCSRDSKHGPSWKSLRELLLRTDQLSVIWAPWLVPLPHAPPVLDWLPDDRLTLSSRVPRHRKARIIRAEVWRLAAGEVVDSCLIALPACYRDAIDQCVAQLGPHAGGWPLNRLLTWFAAECPESISPCPLPWQICIGKHVDLERLQHIFAVNIARRHYSIDYASAVVHDHYYGPTPYSRHGGQLIEIVASLGQSQLCGVEIGVSRGETSAQLLRYFPWLRLLMVDSWTTFSREHPYYKSRDASARRSASEQQMHYQAALANTEFAADRREIWRTESMSAAARISHGTQDFVFIDGDHTYAGVAEDIAAWWPTVRSGGLLAGHDFGHPSDRAGIWGVRRAVDEFANKHALPVHSGRETVWWINKP